MNVWNCFFNVIYNFAKTNRYDDTPEHTALMTVSLLPVLNITCIIAMLDAKIDFVLYEYKYLPFLIGAIIIPINYYFFLKGKKYEKFIKKSHWTHKFFTLIYIVLSISFFYYALFVLSESVKIGI